MRFTILGGRGFIGSHLASYLDSLGYELWVPERNDPYVLSKPLGHVFYCIGLTADFRSRPFDTVRAHVTLLSELLETASFESLLYLSSTRVYSNSTSTSEESPLLVSPNDPSDLYNLSKLLGESLCLCSGRVNVRVARLSNVVGSGMGATNFLGQLVQAGRSGVIRLNTHPDSEKDYIAVDDVVRILLKISSRGRHQIYNVASGTRISHRRWLAEITNVTGCDVQIGPDAPRQSFPEIDIARIRDEFRYMPTDVIAEMIPKLVNAQPY